MFCCGSAESVNENARNPPAAAGEESNREVNISFSLSHSHRSKDENGEEVPQQQIYSDDVLQAARLNWSDMYFDVTRKETILGYGVFGVVLRGTWTPKAGEEHDVAVKLFIQSTTNFPEDEFLKICCAAYDEIEVMKRAEKSIGSTDYIIKAYGLLMGALPEHLAKVLDLNKEGLALSGVGIVMRNEAGGTLANLIYNKKKTTVSLYEKIRILSQIAKGISELHSADIVHADIKPANILLSGETPPEVRLADFGLSILRNKNLNTSILKSTLAMTTQPQGTPVYYSPEMLFNPFEQTNTGGSPPVVAKPSRKTDIYAFALLCWQTLTQKPLFPDITTETLLATMIHKGHRPPIEELPAQTPQNVVDMISCCWDKDRSKRKSAAECHIILNHALGEIPSAPNQGVGDEFTPRQIMWSDIQIDYSRPDRVIIGYGTFGVVVRGLLNDQGELKEVAVKVFIQEFFDDVAPAEEYQRICKRAIQEARLILRAEKYFATNNYPENVIRCHGVTIDALPPDLLALLERYRNSQDFEYSGVGTVMRHEGGGSLANLLFPSQRSSRKRLQIPLVEKLRICLGIARALAGLHAVGIVHADLKLENILLSSDLPPEVRIADFGSSLFGPRPSMLGKSSLAATTHIMGSPVYNAPEILYNPYDEQATTAKPSRKTDMYAFSLLSWEILSQSPLFPEINSEAVLSTVIHQGTRPPISALPVDTPAVVVDMIVSCWDKNRAKRKTALQCVQILESVLVTMPGYQ